MKGDIQYVADTFLIERTFQILSEAESEDGLFRKNADMSSIFGSIGDSIKSFVGGQVHGQDSGGATRTVMNFLTPAIFFRLHPILGLLVTAGQMFGLDLHSIFQKIMAAIGPKLESGQLLSAEDINQAGQSAMAGSPGMAGNMSGDVGSVDDMKAMASSDLLISLRELHEAGMLKNAQGYRGSGGAWSSQPFVPKDSNPFFRMFSFMSPMRRGGLLTGILVWFIKTILLSAGLLAVGGVAANALGVKPPTENNQSSSTPSLSSSTSTPSSSSPSGMPAPTSAGSWNFRPNPGDMWIEDLRGNQPHEQVLDWVLESYPMLSEYEDIILRTPSFWNTVKGISGRWHPGQQELVIPKPYKTRQEIINLFIGDVWGQVQQQMRNA